jgi:AMP-binding enzyme C-terminal domain
MPDSPKRVFKPNPFLDLIPGHVPVAFITATHSIPLPAIVRDLNQIVRKQIGGIFSLAVVVILDRIPKTRSGKTLRRVLREIVGRGIQEDWKVSWQFLQLLKIEVMWIGLEKKLNCGWINAKTMDLDYSKEKTR